MKKVILLLLCVFVFFGCCGAYAQEAVMEMPDIKIVIEGEKQVFPDATIATNGRTLLPVRWTVAALGVPNDDEHIIWNQADQSVTVNDIGMEIYLKLNDNKAKINGKEVILDVPLLAYKGHTYIPIRFISEALNKSVIWDGDIKTVFIRDKEEFNYIKEILNKNADASNNMRKYKISAERRITYNQTETLPRTNSIMKTEVICDMDSNRYYLSQKVNMDKQQSNLSDDGTIPEIELGQEMYIIDKTVYIKTGDECITFILSEETYNEFFANFSDELQLNSNQEYNDILCSILKRVEDLSDEKQTTFKASINDSQIIPKSLNPYNSDFILRTMIDVCSYTTTLCFDKDTYLWNECSTMCKLSQDSWEEDSEDFGFYTTAQFCYNPEEINISVPQEIIDNAVDVSDEVPWSQNGISEQSTPKENTDIDFVEPASVGIAAKDKIVAANTKFGIKLFSKIAETGKSRNIFISPFSINRAMATAYNAADGTTKSAMAKTLELEGINLNDINLCNAELFRGLKQNNTNIQLQVADSLWVRDGEQLKREYAQAMKQYYDAEVQNIVFNKDAVRTINNWVEEKTNSKITDIVQEFSPDTIAVLLDAIYFKADWQDKFDKDNTKEMSFDMFGPNEKIVNMMLASDDYLYYENLVFQAVRIPYKESTIGMYIFLPQKQSSLSNFYGQLNYDNWGKWMSSFKERNGKVGIPRFTLRDSIELKEVLAALGMEVMFSSKNANLENMFGKRDRNVFISEVSHKSFIEVNEEGTEAAAVTDLTYYDCCSIIKERPKPFEMIADRPFFFAITDNTTGLVLFMGSIVDPQE